MRIKITLLAMLLSLGCSKAQQFGNLYVWVDTVSVTQTEHDSLFTQRWESIQFWFNNGSGYVRIGAPDTTGWSSRPWLYLSEGQVVTIGPQTRLLRLGYKSLTTTADLVTIGTKARRQY